MNRVFVLDKRKNQLMPCSPARARILLSVNKAKVHRMNPFTIILIYKVEATNQEIEFKVDPGSKTTGIALVGKFSRGNVLLWGANLIHRGHLIRDALQSRGSLRGSRRNRKTRYRAARFNNRTRKQGWIPPSLQSRVDNVSSWLKKLCFMAPITECHIETVRFDTQKLMNPEISGIEYQQGSLFGYEVREYLLEKWGRSCVYCDKTDVPLEIEHIIPRSKGGSDRISNLTLACHCCNQKKDNMPIEKFVKDQTRLKRILAKTKAPLKDAAAVNATRYAIGDAIMAFGLPTKFWSGGRTKKNRVNQKYKKDHYIDAMCVGESGESVYMNSKHKPLIIKAMGRGNRQVTRTDKFGFPRTKAGRIKRIQGFSTGDLVKLVQPKGKYKGSYIARLASISSRGVFRIISNSNKIDGTYKNFSLINRGDGYNYAN